MKKVKKKEKSRIERVIEKRNIKYLTHFTRIENLPSILQNGLLPRNQLFIQGIDFEINDMDRRDNTDAVCLSISFPNYKLFYRYRMKKPETKWAVILLDPLLLDKLKCSFACRNAASNEMKARSAEESFSMEALHEMFGEIRSGNIRYQMNLDSYETTDPQAEVLVHEIIDPRYIRKIIVLGMEDLDSVQDSLPKSALQIFTIENKLRYYSKQRQEYRSYFDKRSDYQYWR